MFPIRPESRDKRNALAKGKACLSCRCAPQIFPISFRHLIPAPTHRRRGKKKVRRRCLSPCPISFRLFPALCRNAMDSARSAAPAPAPVTANHASTMRMVPPMGTRNATSMGTPPCRPRPAPADQTHMITPPQYHNKHLCPQPTTRAQHLPAYRPRRYLPPCRSASPSMSVRWVTC